jgi:hypothetical protein
MSRVVTIDEYTVPYPGPDVQRVLLDVHRYAEWWPRPLRFSPLEPGPAAAGSRVGVRLGLLSWTATLTGVTPERIELSYAGAWNGTARWSFREVIDGTAVLYRMDVDPRPLWLRLALLRADPGKRQSRRLRPVFTALGKRLEALGVERVPEPDRPEPRPPIAGDQPAP